MASKYYYHKQVLKTRLIMRGIGVCLFSLGVIGLLYVFFPLILWQIYLVPAFASQDIQTPIPNKEIISSASLTSLIENSLRANVNYSDAANWFPTTSQEKQTNGLHAFYFSIPKLGIYNAFVSNADNDLDHHLVNYAGTAIPPQKGTTTVFGHSTIEQWFDPHNYKAIFATVVNLQVDDKFIAMVNGVSYTYIIDRITVVDPDDTSPLQQQYDDSYLNLITCTPPGTTWKRLVIHSRLAKLTNTYLQ